MTNPTQNIAIPKDIALRKLRLFLESSKFVLIGQWGPFQDRFQLVSDGKKYDVILPSNEDIDDYQKRMAEAFEVISRALNVTATEVLTKIRHAGFNKFEIGARPGTKISSISYQEGSQVLFHGAELVRQAAIRAYTNEFRPHNRGRRPASVDRYMERLEIGQTSIGSYVFSLLLPSDDSAMSQGGSAKGSDDRSVVKVLSQGISLASVADKKRRPPAKSQIEETGLSSEFYDHLYEIIDWSDDVVLSLSDPVKVGDGNLLRSRFKRSALVPIKLTSQKIGPPSAPQREKIVGTITNVSEPRIRKTGSIAMKILRDGRPRSIRVPFGFADRDIIIEAFRAKASKFLKVEGLVAIEDNGHLVMEAVTKFDIVNQGPLF
jgi:hypothetical protein